MLNRLVTQIAGVVLVVSLVLRTLNIGDESSHSIVDYTIISILSFLFGKATNGHLSKYENGRGSER